MIIVPIMILAFATAPESSSKTVNCFNFCLFALIFYARAYSAGALHEPIRPLASLLGHSMSLFGQWHWLNRLSTFRNRSPSLFGRWPRRYYSSHRVRSEIAKTKSCVFYEMPEPIRPVWLNRLAHHWLNRLFLIELGREAYFL